MRYLKQNTATRVTVGPFLDKTDGITPETALTATNEHLTLMVDDGGVPTLVLDANATASGGNNDMVHVTNDDAGFYDLELTAAQLNYVGRAMLSINYVTDHLPVFHEFMIVPANVYDTLFGTDKLDVNVSTVADAAQTAGDLAALVVVIDGIVDGIETHVHATDGHIQADYAATEKAAIDLLDDVDGGLADVHTVVNAVKAKTDNLPASPAAVGSAMTLADDAVSAAALKADAITEIWARAGTITTLSVELLLERIYEMLNNKMAVVEASGNVALRNLVDNADVATGNVASSSGTTTRAALSWV